MNLEKNLFRIWIVVIFPPVTLLFYVCLGTLQELPSVKLTILYTTDQDIVQ